MKRKIALIIGHNKKKKGAYSPFLKQYEYDFNKEFVNDILSQLTHRGYHANIFTRNNGLLDAYNRAKTLGSNVFIEFHFNSFHIANAQGAEILYSGSSDISEKTLAGMLLKSWCEYTSINNRGVKKISKGQRGYKNLTQTKKISLLFEPFFGSNESDCDKIKDCANKAYYFTESLIKSLDTIG